MTTSAKITNRSTSNEQYDLLSLVNIPLTGVVASTPIDGAFLTNGMIIALSNQIVTTTQSFADCVVVGANYTLTPRTTQLLTSTTTFNGGLPFEFVVGGGNSAGLWYFDSGVSTLVSASLSQVAGASTYIANVDNPKTNEKILVGDVLNTATYPALSAQFSSNPLLIQANEYTGASQLTTSQGNVPVAIEINSNSILLAGGRGAILTRNSSGIWSHIAGLASLSTSNPAFTSANFIDGLNMVLTTSNYVTPIVTSDGYSYVYMSSTNGTGLIPSTTNTQIICKTASNNFFMAGGVYRESTEQDNIAIMKSTDLKNWVQVNNLPLPSLNSGESSKTIFFDVTTSSIMIGTSLGRLLISSNEGSTWSAVTLPVIAEVKAIAFTGNNYLIGFASGTLIARSALIAGAYTTVNIGITGSVTEFLNISAQHCIAYGSGGISFNNNGGTGGWSNAVTANIIRAKFDIATLQLGAISSSTVYSSVNFGGTITSTSLSTITSAILSDITIFNNNFVIATNSGYIYKILTSTSLSSTANYTAVYSGCTNAFTNLIPYGTLQILGSSRCFKTTDLVNLYQTQSSADFRCSAFLISTNTTILGDSDGFLYQSTNAIDFKIIRKLNGSIQMLKSISTTDYIVTTTLGVIFTSNNLFATFNGLTFNPLLITWYGLIINGSNICVSGNNGTIAYSTNGGISFTIISINSDFQISCGGFDSATGKYIFLLHTPGLTNINTFGSYITSTNMINWTLRRTANSYRADAIPNMSFQNYNGKLYVITNEGNFGYQFSDSKYNVYDPVTDQLKIYQACKYSGCGNLLALSNGSWFINFNRGNSYYGNIFPTTGTFQTPVKVANLATTPITYAITS